MVAGVVRRSAWPLGDGSADRRVPDVRGARALTEDELLAGLLELLGLSGWYVFHVPRSERDPIGDESGFPDIMAVHRERHRCIAIVAASNLGYPTPQQLAWLLELREHPTLEATVVRPASYDAALAWIVGNGPMPTAEVRQE